VFKSDSGSLKGYEPFPEHPFCFNPTIDSAYITFGSLHGGTNFRRFDIWIEHLNTQLPGGVNSIRSLEIRDMDWEAPINAWIQGKPPLPELAKWNKRGGLQMFLGLKELCFTYHRDADNGLRYRRGQYATWRQPLTQQKFDEYSAAVESWFVEHTNNGSKGRVPHITARGFHKVNWSALNIKE
jgi:hypothetical protein